MDRFSLLFFLLFSNTITIAAETPREELMVIQTVSSERRSFVIMLGLKDGIAKGQEAIFSNENITLLCKAFEVNRNFSLWVPIAKNANVPFNKDDFVSYNSHTYGNVALDIVANTENIIPEIDYETKYKRFKSSNNFSVKGSYESGITQSSSEVSANKNANRTGYSIAMEYNFRFLPEFEISTGARFDNEVYRISNPPLDIPTSRTMATIAATYHFVGFNKTKNNLYLSLAAGFGKSSTTVNDNVASGTATLLPEVRIGHLIPFSRTLAMILEGSIDSISANETFPDGTSQVTNTMTAKFTFGLRF